MVKNIVVILTILCTCFASLKAGNTNSFENSFIPEEPQSIESIIVAGQVKGILSQAPVNNCTVPVMVSYDEGLTYSIVSHSTDDDGRFSFVVATSGDEPIIDLYVGGVNVNDLFCIRNLSYAYRYYSVFI